MKILVIGATGTIGMAVTNALSGKHEVVAASRSKSQINVDIADIESIKAMYKKIGKVDVVVSLAGTAVFRPLTALSDADFEESLHNKLMGQVNLVRYGIDYVRDRGQFVLTSGILSRFPMPGGVTFSMTNAALESFARAAAIEMPRGLRVNVVAPGWVTETLVALKMDPSQGIPASDVAQKYVAVINSSMTGAVIDAANTGA
jgi:NAD(P)-dependent dehydrogenase (short-subunit alcohol dehydrogenase family)